MKPRDGESYDSLMMDGPGGAESYAEWLARCVPVVLEDGCSIEQSIRKCNEIWVIHKDKRDISGNTDDSTNL